MAVFHTDDKTHKLVQQYCKRNNFQIKRWMSDVLKQAIDGRVGIPDLVSKSPQEAVLVLPSKKMTLDKVVSKKLDPNEIKQLEDSPWSKPPFWAKE